MSSQFPLWNSFISPYTILNVGEPNKLRRAYKVGKEPLSTFGITLYLSVIKVFYQIHRAFSEIALSGSNNKSDLPHPYSRLC